MIYEVVAQCVGGALFLVLLILPALILSFILCARDCLFNIFFTSPRQPQRCPIPQPVAYPANSALVDADEDADAAGHAGAYKRMFSPAKPARPLLGAVEATLGSKPSDTARERTRRLLAAAAHPDYLGGVPRRVILGTVAAFSTLVTSVFNRSRVHNWRRLREMLQDRPAGTPLITVSNHMSTLDDPLLWGHWWLRGSDPRVCRYTLTAKDICFTNFYFSYFFRCGMSIPIIRGGGIQQECLLEAIDRVNEGHWLHTFPEGRIVQDHVPLSRLKWGVASIIARATVPPIVLCVGHSGYETVMPEKHYFGRRALYPLWGKTISIVVGEPLSFDVPALRRQAEAAAAGTGDPAFGLDAVAPPAVTEGPAGAPSAAGAPNLLVSIEEGSTPIDPILTRAQAIAVAGDEATRRLYSHIAAQLRESLDDLVQRAHQDCKERRGE